MKSDLAPCSHIAGVRTSKLATPVSLAIEPGEVHR